MNSSHVCFLTPVRVLPCCPITLKRYAFLFIVSCTATNILPFIHFRIDPPLIPNRMIANKLNRANLALNPPAQKKKKEEKKKEKGITPASLYNPNSLLFHLTAYNYLISTSYLLISFTFTKIHSLTHSVFPIVSPPHNASLNAF